MSTDGMDMVGRRVVMKKSTWDMFVRLAETMRANGRDVQADHLVREAIEVGWESVLRDARRAKLTLPPTPVGRSNP